MAHQYWHLTNTRPAKDRLGDFAKFLKSSFDEENFDPLRGNEQTGNKPAGQSVLLVLLTGWKQRLAKYLSQRRKDKGAGDIDSFGYACLSLSYFLAITLILHPNNIPGNSRC